MKLKETFSTIPEQYDKARLDYPSQMFRDVIQYAGLKKSDPILEIGIGTGKASEPFVRRGNAYVANDISIGLVTIARRNLKRYRRVKYIIKPFENIKLPKNRFGLIFSAQTFHWIKPSTRFSKTHALLKPGGTLALMWNYNYYDRGIGKMALRLHKKYSRARGGKADAIIKQLKAHKQFTHVTLKEYQRNLHMTHQEYITMQTSFSWYLALSEKRKKQALADLKHIVSRFPKNIPIPIRTKLVMAKKK
ncbi:MAG: class I SAM-dependent methyltransferase [Candidatus Kerfeldbacteria bacterium]|nr:class I SAM-dependent methyltransferase [Candidatus Kerfeldbacteria bacterium]